MWDALCSSEDLWVADRFAPLQSLSSTFRDTLNDIIPDKHKHAEEFWAFVLLHLSTFRRTRNLATLRHLLGPLFGRDDATTRLDKLLTALSEIPGLGITRISGGGVWFDRATRDTVYTQNTEYTSTSRLKDFLRLPAGEYKETRTVIMQLFLLTTTHQRISRSYYNRAFVQSRDCSAFLEYTYHRVSAIRYLAKLIAVVEHLKDSTGIIEDALARCGTFMRLAVSGSGRENAYEGLLERLELSLPDRSSTGKFKWIALLSGEKKGQHPDLPSELLIDLRERHAWELRCLFRGWVRAEAELRSQIPAQQLLYWCDALRTEELPNRLNSVVLDYDSGNNPICYKFKHLSPNPSAKGDDTAIANPLGTQWIKAFGEFLLNLQIKLHIDRTAYKEASELIKKRDSNNRPLRRLHDMLDEATCSLRIEQRDNDSDKPSANKSGTCEEALNSALDMLKEPSSLLGVMTIEKADEAAPLPAGWGVDDVQSAVSDWHEANLRYDKLRAEASLGEPSVFTSGFDAATFGSDTNRANALAVAKEAVNHGPSRLPSADPQRRHGTARHFRGARNRWNRLPGLPIHFLYPARPSGMAGRLD